MISALYSLLFVLGVEGGEYLNGIVAVVNTEVITFRNVQIYAGLKMLRGGSIDAEHALNYLIEESLVWQEVQKLGIEIEAYSVEECEKDVWERIAEEKMNNLLRLAELSEPDINKRCTREMTMEAFLEKKFLDPLLAGIKSGGTSPAPPEQRAIESYKSWVIETVSKSRVELFPENLKGW